MMSVFGSENQRGMQKMLLNEINFYEGENFEAIIRLEMCDDCEWNWINLDMRLEGRGRFKHPEGGSGGSRSGYEGMTSEAFKTEARQLISQITISLEQGNYDSAVTSANQLRTLNDAWNEVANNVWEEIEINNEPTAGEDSNDPYYWIKQDQAQRQKAKSLRQANYEDRKAFYLGLFLEYDKREYYFEQKEWEKRLIQEFKEDGEEICNNNIDDNANEQTDCEEAQCGGQVCGRGTATVGNVTAEVNFYCISGTCQAKSEEEPEEIVCGNHVCEEGENLENCAEDCVTCPTHEAIECDGKVIFGGEDENKCPLPPVCISEITLCQTNEDCPQPRCGVVECLRFEPEDQEGKCEFTKLEECQEAECIEGENKVKTCGTGGEIIAETCIEDMWQDTGVVCTIIEEDEEATIEEEEIVGEECIVAGDCGGANDVCSNGKCVTIPEVIPTEPEPEPIEIPEQEEEQEEPEPEPELEPEDQEEAPTGTGEIIFGFFRALIGRITGNSITSLATDTPEEESADSGDSTEDETSPASESEPETSPEPEEPGSEEPDEGEWTDDGGEWQDDSGEWEDKDRREREGHEEEQGQRCNQECMRPCVDRCIRESCGESMECDIDQESQACESECSPSADCVEACMSGDPDWWKEFQEEQEQWQEEKGVFAAGGSCRKQKGETEGFIWLNGWGDPFEEIQPLKNKYYSGGHADWCKYDLENFVKQRQEFEKGFNQDFAIWFFEKYLPSSAEDWEQAVSGIYELYWNNVENQMQLAHRMQCLEINDIGELMNYNLIEINYDTEFGSIEYWEEANEVKIPGLDEKVTIISPYMKVWVFPSQEFMKYEMRESMKNHEFPGPPEEKMERGNKEGLTDEEREKIRENRAFMRKIVKISEKYNGNVDAAVQFKDEAGEIVFNLYVQINEQDIIEMEPMLPSENPELDITIEIPFSELYEMIYFSEKEMMGAEIESPPWDRRSRFSVKRIINGVRMSAKMRRLVNSAQISPSSAESDAKSLFKTFIKMMGKGDRGPGREEGEDSERGKDEEREQEPEDWESKEEITGEIISDFGW